MDGMLCSFLHVVPKPVLFAILILHLSLLWQLTTTEIFIGNLNWMAWNAEMSLVSQTFDNIAAYFCLYINHWLNDFQVDKKLKKSLSQ